MKIYLRRKKAGEYDHELLWGLLALPLVLLAGFTIALLWADHLFCGYRQFTGYRCPGCGLTHALLHLFHGDVAAALQSNALAVFALSCAVAYIAYSAVVVLFRLPRIRVMATRREKSLLAATGLLAVLLFWALRIYWP